MSYGRHKTTLFQTHFNEVKTKKLEIGENFIARPIFIRKRDHCYDEETEQELRRKLEHLELCYQKIFKKLGYKIYHVPRFLASQVQVAAFVTNLELMSKQEISKIIEQTKLFGKTGACVKIYKVGVFANVSEALLIFNKINKDKTPLPLTTFRRYLNENRFPGILTYISEKQYLHELKNSSLDKDQKLDLEFSQPKAPSNVKINPFTVNLRATCVRVIQEKGKGVYPSLEKASEAIGNIARSTLGRHLDEGKNQDKYVKISRDEFEKLK